MHFDLPPIDQQAERLIELGVHEMAGLSAGDVREAATGHGDVGLLTVHEKLAPASVLTPLLELGNKRGFIVVDMADVDLFTPTEQSTLHESPLHLHSGVDRGDHLANWSPDEALPAIVDAHRTPLTLTEGIHWLLQRPDILERGKCFMTIGSRLRKPDGSFDTRTPAVWISNGTGRDGKDNRNAPKVGWCWWGNRHTWLGFASASDRVPLPN